MGIAAIAAGILALLFTIGGFVASPIPVLGLMLSFLAPVLALVGIILGGVGLSRAKQMGEETGAPMAGLIVSIIAFIPAVLVALTCGVCNSMCTSSYIQGATHGPRQSGSLRIIDGGLTIVPQNGQPIPWPTQPSQPAQPSQPGQAVPPPPPGQYPSNPYPNQGQGQGQGQGQIPPPPPGTIPPPPPPP